MRTELRRLTLLLGAAVLLAVIASVPRPAAVAVAASNPIVSENLQPGSAAWQLSNTANDVDAQIKGYASATSVNQNQSIAFYVTVNPVQTYTIDVYRVGWYGGLGGRLMLHDGPFNGISQAPCPVDPTTGLIACAWAASYNLTIPGSWTSGVYLALLTNAQGYTNYIIFVVKDGRSAPYLYQAAFNTYQAYNDYPADPNHPTTSTGKSLYTFNSYGPNTVSGETRAVKVSFDRPFTALGSGQFLIWEVYFIRWLERSGYDVTYTTDLDTHANGSALLGSKGFLSVGHDEYWSKEMFDAAQNARDAGVGLGFFGADAVYWQVRYEASAMGAPNRVMVCYKNASLDPVQGPTTTALFRDPPVNRPEQSLMGVQYTSSVAWGTSVGYHVSNSSHWAYSSTGFKDGDVAPGIVGYEMDRFMPNYPAPASLSRTLLSQSPYTNDMGVPDYANSSIYQAPSGAWVFAAGTTSWSQGLDGLWNNTAVDARIQRTTANVLNAFVTGAPPSLTVTAPAATTAGQAVTTTVTAVNAQGSPVTTYSGTVHLTSSDPAAVLPADYTFTSTDAGAHQFQVTLKTAGNQTVIATDTASSVTTGRTPVSVAPASAFSVTLSGLTGGPAGTAQTATVTANDSFGNVATGYGGTVSFSSTDSQATLPVSYAFGSADNGVHSFAGGVILRTPGSQAVTVADTANPSLTSTQSGLVVTQTVASLSVSGLTNAAAGTAQSVTVTARDAGGAVVTGYTGTVAFASSDGQATLPGSYTFVAADNGVHTYPAGVTLKTAGAQTVTATDTAASSVTGSQTVTITPGSLDHLGLTPGAASITAGAGQNYTATGFDQYGNSWDATATTSFSIAPNGSCTGATCSATLSGAHTVTGSNAGRAATSSLNVIPGAASQLLLAAPGSVPANQAFSISVTLKDQFGNIATGYTGTIHFTTSDALVALLGGMPADYTFTAADAGTHSFSATLRTAGTQSITAADTSNGGLSGSAQIAVRLL